MNLKKMNSFTVAKSLYIMKIGQSQSLTEEPLLFCASKDNKVRVYSITNGIMSSESSWDSSRLTSLTTGDLTGDRHIELITTSIDGKIYAVESHHGELVWSASFPVPIIDCLAADINDDGDSELFLLLDGGRYALIQIDQTDRASSQIIWKGRLSGNLIAASKVYFSKTYYFVVGTKDGLISVIHEGNKVASFSIDPIKSLCTIVIEGKPYILTTKDNILVFYNFNGEKVNNLPFNSPIRLLSSFQKDTKNYLAVYLDNQEIVTFSTDTQISLVDLPEADKEFFKDLIYGIISKVNNNQGISVEEIEKLIIESINSTKINFSVNELIKEMIQNLEIKGYFKGNSFFRS